MVESTTTLMNKACSLIGRWCLLAWRLVMGTGPPFSFELLNRLDVDKVKCSGSHLSLACFSTWLGSAGVHRPSIPSVRT